MTGPKIKPVGELTPRQREIVQAIIKNPGGGYKDVAHELGITTKSVKAHSARIFDRTDTGSMLEVVVNELKNRGAGMQVKAVNGQIVMEPLRFVDAQTALLELARGVPFVCVDGATCEELKQVISKIGTGV